MDPRVKGYVALFIAVAMILLGPVGAFGAAPTAQTKLTPNHQCPEDDSIAGAGMRVRLAPEHNPDDFPCDSPSTSPTEEDKKVYICHKTSSETNPWVFQSISENAYDQHVANHGDGEEDHIVDETYTKEKCNEEFEGPDVEEADLSISKSDSPDPVDEGDDITYTITVTNNGPDTAVGVDVDDNLPDGLTLVSASTTQGTCNSSDPVHCDIGDLDDGEDATVTIVATVDDDDTEEDDESVSNTATTDSDTGDTDTDDNSATEETDVTDDDGENGGTKVWLCHRTGADVNNPWVILDINENGLNGHQNSHGDGDEDVILDPAGAPYDKQDTSVCDDEGDPDPDPDKVWMCHRTGSGNNPWVIISVPENSQGHAGDNDAGHEDVVLDEEPEPGVPPGQKDTSVCDDDPDPDPEGEDLSITKTADESVDEGGTLTYTITVKNKSSDTSSRAEVSDLLPEGTTYVSSSYYEESSCDDSEVEGRTLLECDLGVLSPGETVVITVVVTVDEDEDEEDETLENTASVCGEDVFVGDNAVVRNSQSSIVARQTEEPGNNHECPSNETQELLFGGAAFAAGDLRASFNDPVDDNSSTASTRVVDNDGGGSCCSNNNNDDDDDITEPIPAPALPEPEPEPEPDVTAAPGEPTPAPTVLGSKFNAKPKPNVKAKNAKPKVKGGSLPFTGQSPWTWLMIGLLMTAAGLVLIDKTEQRDDQRYLWASPPQ